MEIIYFIPKNSISIRRSFTPLINEISKLEDVSVFELPYSGSNPINLLKNILFIKKHSSKHGINHLIGDAQYGIIGLIGRISVLTIHDDYAIIKARRGWIDKIYKYIFWLWIPIRVADKILCITETTKLKIEKYVKSNKMITLTNHCCGDMFLYQPKVLNKDCIHFLQIGTLPQKNLETTLKVLSKYTLPYRLCVIKPMTTKQYQLASALGVNYINKFGLTDQQIVEEYTKADIILFPSIYEGLGMPILEGQAVGRVVITTNKEPMKTISGGKEAAILLDNPLDTSEYMDKLVDIVDNEEKRELLIQNGRINAAKYCVTNIVESFIELYKELFNEDNRN